MNREVRSGQNVQCPGSPTRESTAEAPRESATSESGRTPRADAARPVLHFTGRADLLASLGHLPHSAWYSVADPMPDGRHEDFVRTMIIMRTLRTGAAP